MRILGDVMKDEKGNALIISGIFIVIAFSIFVFLIAIFMGHINSLLYSIKIDMYSINRAAIIAINKNKGNIDVLNYDKKSYKSYFEDSLRANYDLNKDFINEQKMISKIKILEYDIIPNGKIDNFTKERVDNTVIHTVVQIKVKPIIMAKIFEDVLTFNIHEDVNLNMLKN